MSENSKRPFKRVDKRNEDKSVSEIGSTPKKVKVGTARNLKDLQSQHTRQKDVPAFLVKNEEIVIIPTNVSDKIDGSLTDEDKKVIAVYLNTNTQNVRANQMVSPDYLIAVDYELQEYPFWIYINADEQDEIRDLYLEYYYHTLLLQSYSNFSDSVPDDEEILITRLVEYRALIISNREGISNQIGAKANTHLENIPNDSDIIVIPVEFEDEIDYSSNLHQTILLNATIECKNKSRRVI